jgi:hypothetical protein
MTSSEEHLHAVIARQAGEWFATIEDGLFGEEERVAFTAWLKASPLHVKEFLGVAVIARDLPEAADDPDFPVESLLEQARTDDAEVVVVLDQALRSHDAPQKRLGLPRAWVLAAAAAVVALFAWLVWLDHDGELLGLPKTLGLRTVSRRLAPSGRLSAASQYRRRGHCALFQSGAGSGHASGQAYFQVARDGQRRFRVTSGEAQCARCWNYLRRQSQAAQYARDGGRRRGRCVCGSSATAGATNHCGPRRGCGLKRANSSGLTGRKCGISLGQSTWLRLRPGCIGRSHSRAGRSGGDRRIQPLLAGAGRD